MQYSYIAPLQFIKHSSRVKDPLGITLLTIKPRITTHTFAQILPGPKLLYDILRLKLRIPLFCFSLGADHLTLEGGGG